VIDLMRGQVVRGVGGRRDEYRPVESILAADARPQTVGRAFADAGFREAYIADLDAIGGSEPAWKVYEELLSTGLNLWVDAGVSVVEQACALAQFAGPDNAISSVVVGLESLRRFRAISDIGDAIGSEKLVFSLDLKVGVPLATHTELEGSSAWQITTAALSHGVRRMIVLDLAAVGMGQGVGTEPLCRDLRRALPELEIIAGGGVRGWDDLRSLEAAGCNAALVASALHDGRLPARECAALR
jgi:phosphoribosylformimino-5-aminoimidazole carboxamide ribotide isomerase